MPVTTWRRGFAITGRARKAIAIDEELYHQVATFHAGKMVRTEYFVEWSEALEAGGLSD